MIKSKLIIIKDLTIIFLKDSYQDLNIFDKKIKYKYEVNLCLDEYNYIFVLLYLSQKQLKL